MMNSNMESRIESLLQMESKQNLDTFTKYFDAKYISQIILSEVIMEQIQVKGKKDK